MALIMAIGLSIIIVMLDGVAPLRERCGIYFRRAEWALTIIFTVEYLLRPVSVGRPFRYAVSFFGIIDPLSIVPTYLSLVFPEGRYLLVIRAPRVLRRSSPQACSSFAAEGHDPDARFCKFCGGQLYALSIKL